MTEDLWYHALKFLDRYRTDIQTYDVSDLYEFADTTGILERHKQLLSEPFKEGQVDMKIMYYELIRMLIDYERKNHPQTYDATKTVGKIEGYQELTNKLQRYLNQRFIEDIEELSKQQVNITNINIASKFEHLEQTVIRLEEKCHKLEKSHNGLSSNYTELEESMKTIEDKNAALKESYFNLEGDYSNLQQKFYKLEENSSLLQEKVITMEKNEKSLTEEIEKLKQAENKSGTNFTELIAFREQQLKSNEVVEEQLNLHTQVSKTLQSRVERNEQETSTIVIDCQEMNRRILKLEDTDTAFESWMKDSDISHRMSAIEKNDQNMQNRITKVENDSDLLTQKIEINSTAIENNRTEIDRFSKLHNTIVGEINTMKETSVETREHLNTFISKHNETIKDINDLINVSQSNFSNVDVNIQDLNNKLGVFDSRIKDQNEKSLKHIEDLFGGQNDLGQRLFNLQREFDGTQEQVKSNLSIIREENIHRLQMVDEQMKNTNEKLFSLETAHQQQLQKNSYFENMNLKMNKLEEMRQQSEAKARDEVDATISQNNKVVNQLANDFGDKFVRLEEMLRQEQNELNKYSESVNTELKAVKGDSQQLINKIEEVAGLNRKMLNDFDQSLNSKFRKYEEIHTSELERIEQQLQESTFIQAEKVGQLDNLETKVNQLEKQVSLRNESNDQDTKSLGNQISSVQKEMEESFKSIQSSFENTLVKYQGSLEDKVTTIQEETKLNTKSLVEIEPMAKSIESRVDGMKQQIIIENNRHFESFRSEVSSTMMKVTERNNTVEKHFETIKDNSEKIKSDLQEVLKQDLDNQMMKIVTIKEETDKALKSTDLMISTVVEKIENLESADKAHKQKELNLESLIEDTKSKLSELESADLFLQEAHRNLTEKSASVDKEMKLLEKTIMRDSEEQKTHFDNKLKNEVSLLQEGNNSLINSINSTNNKLSDIEVSMNTSNEGIMTKIEDDIKNVEKSSKGRITDLETTISKYYEQILQNSNNIQEVMPKVVILQEDLKKNLEPRVKTNEDEIKHVDDTLDGLKKSLDGLASKQSEAANTAAELNVLINNTQVQLKEQEKKLVDQNNSDITLVKGQIKDLENQSGVCHQKIAELDNGAQGLLEKLLGLEAGTNDKINQLNDKENNIETQIQKMKSDNDASSDGLKQELAGKLGELKEEYLAATNSVRTETHTLSQSLQEYKSQQISIEKRVTEIDSGNQQLLEKILAVEQDLEGKVQGINSSSGNLSDKISSLENNAREHAQSLVTIQESIAIQVNDMKKVESERQNAAVRVKEDLDATNAANTKAISGLKDEFSSTLSALEVSIKKDQEDGKSALSDRMNKVENDIGARMLVLEQSGPDSLKTLGESLNSRLDAMDNEMDSKLRDVKERAEKNANEIAGQSNLLREHNDSINSNITSITSISNKLAASDKDLDAIKENVVQNRSDIDNLRASQNDLQTKSSDLEAKVKSNQDHLKNVDDTLDGLHKSNEVFEARHVETVEKMKEMAVLTSSVQSQLMEQELKIVEQSTSNLNIIRDQIQDLENQQGVSAQKIQELDSGTQGLLEKILGAEKKFGEGFSQLESADKSIIESITVLSTSTNENLANLRRVIEENKNMLSDKMSESDKIIVSRFGDVDKEIKSLNEASTRHAQIMHTIEMLEDKLNNLDEKQPKIKSDLQKLEVNVISNTEKIFALEEMNVIQVEKAQYVETLSARVNQIDEMRQKSEAKSQEQLTSKNVEISKELDDLRRILSSSVKSIDLLTPRVDHLETKITQNMEEVSSRIKSTSEETSNVLSRIREEQKSSIFSAEEKIQIVTNDVKSIQSEIESCFNDQEAKLQKMLSVTEDHGNLFTSITTNINNMETKMSSYDSKQKAVTENILVTSEAQLTEFRHKFDSRITEIMRRIDEHSDQFDQNELSIVDLKKVVGENYLHTQRDLEELRKRIGNEQESVVMRISEQRETIESLFNSLQEKIERHEKTQIRESSRMEYVEKKSESNERHVLQLDRRVTEVEKLGEDTTALWKQLGELQEYANNSRADLQSIRTDFDTDHENYWTLLLEIYSAFRGYTVVLKSEGIVKKHQADVLGVYRMVDSYNDRPVYKQDGGENYIYYSSASNTWFVGTVVGHQYGWLRNSTESASSRRWIPDLKSGWEYRPLVRTMDHLDSNSWHSDDGSLRIEYLRDVEKVNELFRDVKDIQKAD